MIEVILNALKHDVTKIRSKNEVLMISSSSQNDSDTVMDDPDKEVDTHYTELDKTLSLCLRFEFTDPETEEVKVKDKFCKYVIDIKEYSDILSDNFIRTVKIPAVEELISENYLKYSEDVVFKNTKVHILNAPELILMK